MLIAAGRDALAANPGYQAFMRSLPQLPEPRAVPRAAPVAAVPEVHAHEARVN